MPDKTKTTPTGLSNVATYSFPLYTLIIAESLLIIPQGQKSKFLPWITFQSSSKAKMEEQAWLAIRVEIS